MRCVTAHALVALAAAFLGPFPAAADDLRAGAAARVITPPPGTPMAGYYSARAVQEVHDDLHAKALVLESGATRAALIVLDLITIPRDLVEQTRAAIEAATGIPATHVMISATHTHTGPSLSGSGARSGDFGGREPIAISYRETLPALITQTVADAVEHLAPAQVRAAHGAEQSIAFNRRFHMTDGTVGWNPGKRNPSIVKPAGPIDPDVPILLFETAGDRPAPIAMYVNYAVHLDNIGGAAVSADLPGVLSQTLAQVMGPDMVTLWSAGCCGDINHINVNWAAPQKGFDNAARMGVILGAEVLRNLPELQPVATSPIQASIAMVELDNPPISEDDIAQAHATIARRKSGAKPEPSFLETVQAYKVLDVAESAGKPTTVEVQVISLGPDIAWVSLPGEIFVEIGLALKARSPFGTTIPVELANGSVGYIPTSRAYAQGNYEVVSARVAEGSDQRLIDAALSLLRTQHERATAGLK